ncbi:MAG: tetratricopeptide repeat protein [Promethearchaeota archaeon]
MKSIELNPNFFEGWIVLGILLLRNGQAEESEKAFRKLTETAPRMPEAWDLLGLALSAQGKNAEATEAKNHAQTLRA